MTLMEYQHKIRNLEAEIYALIQAFENETSTQVRDVNLTHRLCVGERVGTIVRVEVRTEI